LAQVIGKASDGHLPGGREVPAGQARS